MRPASLRWPRRSAARRVAYRVLLVDCSTIQTLAQLVPRGVPIVGFHVTRLPGLAAGQVLLHVGDHDADGIPLWSEGLTGECEPPEAGGLYASVLTAVAATVKITCSFDDWGGPTVWPSEASE